MKTYLVIYYGGESSELIQADTIIQALQYIIGNLDQVYKVVEVRN